MLNIPGRNPGFTCEGPTRRELMRIGSLGLAGLHLPGFFLSQQAAKANDTATSSSGHTCASSLSGAAVSERRMFILSA